MTRSIKYLTLLSVLSLTVFPTLSSWAAQARLNAIQFSTTPVEVRITIKSDTTVPFHVVSQSDEKIVVDLSAIDATQSIPTDFTGANNIDQVVLKPIGNDTLRMTIRGEQLGAPAIQVASRALINNINAARAGLQSQSAAINMAALETTPQAPQSVITNPQHRASHVQAPLESGYALTSVQTTPNKAVAASGQPAPNNALIQPDTAVQPADTAQPAVNPMQPEAFQQGGSTAAPIQDASATPIASDRPAIADAHTAPQEIDTDAPETGFLGGIAEGLRSWFHQNQTPGTQGPDIGLLARLAGVGAMLVMLGMFIWRKACNLQSGRLDQNSSSEDIWAGLSNTQPARGNASLKGRRPLAQREALPARKPATANRHATAATSDKNSRPIGLGGLIQEQHAALPNKPLLNRNQALNQYGRQQKPLPATARLNNRTIPALGNSDLTKEEMRRSALRKTAVSQSQQIKPYGSQSPAARPVKSGLASQQAGYKNNAAASNQLSKPSKSTAIVPKQPAGQLENNPQVLDFLRSVADLMEKDGRTNLAQGVKRSMRPQ